MIPSSCASLRVPYSAKLVRDQIGEPAVLFQSTWDAEYAARDNPGIGFLAVRMNVKV